jgi:putative ABC transport system ATP-binding protein
MQPTALVGERLRFPVGPRTAEVSLSVAGGEALQVAGPSGSGKTTLLKILARLRAPEAGGLRLDGCDAAEIEPRTWRRRVAYLAQRPVAFPGTVEDNLRLPFGLRIARDAPYDPERTAGLLDRFGLPPGRFLGQDAMTLSVGELQRMSLVRTLLASPEVLLADEPTASVDAETARGLTEHLRGWAADGGALVLVIHDESLWGGFDRRRLDLEEHLAEEVA